MTEEKDGNIDSSKLLFPFLAVIAGLILDEVNKRVKFLGIPDSVLQFLFAMSASMMLNQYLPSDSANSFDSSYSWTSLEPSTILTVLLPPLIFESSFKINSHSFFAKFGLICSLTIAIYVVTLLISSIFLLPVLYTMQNLKISSVFLFVSIIVATDPVAVVAMLEQYGAPHRLRLLIEGESLLNDGLALTAYRVLVEVLKAQSNSFYTINYGLQCWGLFMCLLVSPLMGWLGAASIAWLVGQMEEIKKQQAVIVASVYGIFVLCDKCGGSSALGLVFFGITLNYCKEQMSPETSRVALSLWGTLGYWANNIIFIYAGYLVGREMFSKPPSLSDSSYMTISTEDIYTLLLGILISPVPLLARMLSIWMYYKMHRLFSRKQLPPNNDFVILAYAGLRGALGLILAMELTKTEGLEEVKDPKKILLLTCSITFSCLVFQGMTFPAVSNKEGTTRRSKYIKDTCLRLSRFLSMKIQRKLLKMQHEKSKYLRGANWRVVESKVSLCMQEHQKDMEAEWMASENGNNLSVRDISVKESRERRLVEKKKIEMVDAKIGFYGILLARLQESWAQGAVSGSTAHVLVALLEHGIDEGDISAGDIEDHLNIIAPSLPFRMIACVIEQVYSLIRGESWINRFCFLGGERYFTVGDKARDTKVKRHYEKWWIFHTMCLSIYFVLLVWAVFDWQGSHVKRSVVYIAFSLVALTAAVESVYIYHYKMFSPENPNYDMDEVSRARQQSWWSRIILKEFLLWLTVCILMSAGLVLSILMMQDGLCMGNITTLNKVRCEVYRWCHLISLLVYLLYRIVRMAPVTIVVLREHCQMKKMSCDRVRLAAFHFLHHLMVETKISKDLFSEDAYKTVRKEQIRFNKLVEGVMRLELKEHAEEIGLIPVVKTRQAVRIMSFALDEMLASLKTEGFLPDEAAPKWDSAVHLLRDCADDILVVPPVEIRPGLEMLPWLRKLSARKKSLIVSMLVDNLADNTRVKSYPPGETITTNSLMYYIRKGYCKVTERVHERSHQYYLSQGDFIGERNLLLIGSTTNKRPLMYPRIRYQATTSCEVVELTTTVMKELIDVDGKLYEEMAAQVQARGILTELRHRNHLNDLTLESFWGKPRIIPKREKVVVPEGSLAIIGCWTNVKRLVPKQNLTRDWHVKGPATLWLEPADQRANGMVYIDSSRAEGTTTVEEHSNISLIHDIQHKVRERQMMPPPPSSDSGTLCSTQPMTSS